MADTFRIATYNVENLFDRFDDPYSAGDDPWGKFGSSPKPRSHSYEMAYRIRQSGADIVGLQEIENFGALVDFVQGSVGPKFRTTKGIVSQQSNDPRGIDLGLLSALPLGRVISHRFNEFQRPSGKNYRFPRDCLQIEVLDKDRTGVLLTAFICHFKSKYSPYHPVKEAAKYAADQAKSADKREAEAREVIRIVQAGLNPAIDRFVIMGDLNDTPDSAALAPLCAPGNVLGLTNATSQLAQADLAAESPTRRPRDTHLWNRYDPVEQKKKKSWSQIDHMLCSPALWALRSGKAKVINSPQEQGSDHYISWAEFNAPAGMNV
jgi:endonuclease/exonuclease/phosphatase family metal-dependent hydrolase